MMMTIILLWVAGVCLLIGVAVYRGRKKGVTQPSKEESSKSSADRVINEIQSLHKQISEVNKKLDHDRLGARVQAGSSRALDASALTALSPDVLFKSMADTIVPIEIIGTENHPFSYPVHFPYLPVFEQSSVLVTPEVKKVNPVKRPVGRL